MLFNLKEKTSFVKLNLSCFPIDKVADRAGKVTDTVRARAGPKIIKLFSSPEPKAHW